MDNEQDLFSPNNEKVTVTLEGQQFTAKDITVTLDTPADFEWDGTKLGEYGKALLAMKNHAKEVLKVDDDGRVTFAAKEVKSKLGELIIVFKGLQVGDKVYFRYVGDGKVHMQVMKRHDDETDVTWKIGNDGGTELTAKHFFDILNTTGVALQGSSEDIIARWKPL